jgi:amino-acid N-acetyltransferase
VVTISSGITLRSARAEDLDWARKHVAAMGLPVDGLDEHFGTGFVVAVAGEERVGLGGVEVYGDFGLLRSVAVAPPWRGRAVGRSIVERLVRWSQRRGLRALYLLTETAPAFFEQVGFEQIGREAFPEEVKQSKEYAEVCPDTAAAMRLVL